MKRKLLGMMAGFSHDSLLPLEVGACPYLFLQMVPDQAKIFRGQTIYLYEKRKPGYGVAAVIGEAKIEDYFILDAFPYQPVFRFWAETVKENQELVEAIDRIGDFRLPGYKPEYTFSFGLFDPEYLEYAKKHGKLPDTFNDFYHDYKDHPEHGIGREDARNTLAAYDAWLTSMAFYDDFGRNNNVFALKLADLKLYDEPRDVGEFRMEIRMKPFTRAPQGLMYTWDGRYLNSRTGEMEDQIEIPGFESE